MRTTALMVRWLVVTALLASGSMSLAQQSPPDSQKAKEIVALVDKAAALVAAKGKSAFAEFKKSDTEWRHDDVYLFGNDMKGTQILNAGFPEREGSDQSKFKDATGKLVWPEFVKVAKSSKGSGWVTYEFPKPGQTKPSKKWSYLKAVTIDGAPSIVGAGFYPE